MIFRSIPQPFQSRRFDIHHRYHLDHADTVQELTPDAARVMADRFTVAGLGKEIAANVGINDDHSAACYRWHGSPVPASSFAAC